jgi:hypothetical protein
MSELSLPPGARAVLNGPDALARMLAAAARDPEQRWLLRRPQAVRRAFVAQVIDRGGDDVAQRRWMLLQDPALRTSYVEEVLLAAKEPDREAIWLLRQKRAVCASYVAEVLDGGQGIGSETSVRSHPAAS